MFKKILVFPTLLLCVLISCSSGDSGGGKTPDNPKINVAINTEIVGTTVQMLNGDGNGLVKFNITPSSGVSYKIVFGDGEIAETTTGTITHTYKSSGTKTYTIDVTVFNGLKYFTATKSIVVFVATIQVWGDEFNIDGAPDSNKWALQLWDPGRVNNELQSYTNRPENVIIEGGVLKIKAIREKYGKGDFTSARLESNGKFDFTYGKIVIRAKVPTGVGTWPAVWMLGSNIGSVGWPAWGERDILDSVGKNPNQNHSSLHSPGRSGNTPDTSTIKVPNDNTEFHIYTADWRADYIKFSVDDVVYYTFVNSDKFPFNKNFYLIVNLAMGGVWGGPVDPNFTSSTLQVDYIRVYN
ncbi:glycoside hydrolase family 16 protein [Flavobacterium bomense]|nr:glycoside hydrolase family 16 protein [Flavobacterium bomense]